VPSDQTKRSRSRSLQSPGVGFGALSAGRTAIAASLALTLLAGCGGGRGGTTIALPPGCTRVARPAPKQLHLARPAQRLRGATTATIETSCGSFSVALEVARAPKTASSFAYLARHGAYDGTLFHRIIPGFVVQGGDPTGTGSGGPGYFVDEPPPRNLSYTQGTVAMAKSPVEPPGRSGSQFFVVTAADAGLTPDYALIGHVTSGFDVVRRIEQLGTPSGAPRAPVVIRRIVIQGG
jgi:peptidyl-prolyl cis-trans isomerase B (cyclophilin B)